MKKVRVRIAPSPTGPFHMGSVRTALFNYLYAKQHGGDFIVRSEDTDKTRSEKQWERDALENLKWAGLEWDEGPLPDGTDQGPHAPYRQSERGEIYKKYLNALLEAGRAYYCFCTQEELDAQRQSLQSNGETPRYLGTCRGLSKEEQRRRLADGTSAVIRFAMPAETVAFHDLVRGEVKFDTALLGDIVIAKDLETPLYNFTVVVDDYEMGITHVIRGEDHIPNTPKQILLQEALGFPRVAYAHLPLLLAEDRTKLSKRHGDNSVSRFRKEGYLPEAIVNFLALLGWNPGTDRELFSLSELIKEFSLERVQKGGAVFNVRRLDWINGSYVRSKSVEELTLLCLPFLRQAGFAETMPIEKTQKAVSLYQERMKKLSDIVPLAGFFFREQLAYSKSLLRWKHATEDETKEALRGAEALLERVGEGEWTKDSLAMLLLAEAEKQKDRGYLLWPLRVALTGEEASAGPFEVAEALGKEETLRRIRAALSLLGS